MDEKLQIQNPGTAAKLAQKLREIRGGNRLMASNDVGLSVTFYRRDQPEKKCGTMKLSGVFDYSLLDFGIALGAMMLMMQILGAVVRVLRRIR